MPWCALMAAVCAGGVLGARLAQASAGRGKRRQPVVSGNRRNGNEAFPRGSGGSRGPAGHFSNTRPGLWPYVPPHCFRLTSPMRSRSLRSRRRRAPCRSGSCCRRRAAVGIQHGCVGQAGAIERNPRRPPAAVDCGRRYRRSPPAGRRGLVDRLVVRDDAASTRRPHDSAAACVRTPPQSTPNSSSAMASWLRLRSTRPSGAALAEAADGDAAVSAAKSADSRACLLMLDAGSAHLNTPSCTNKSARSLWRTRSSPIARSQR
jgi:hypothetical protein